jgi:hypothetical protein
MDTPPWLFPGQCATTKHPSRAALPTGVRHRSSKGEVDENRILPLHAGVLRGVPVCIGLTNLSPSAIRAYAEEAKATAPQVVLAETYNAVTRIYFTNTAVHKGSHKPGLVERRFRADVKYWLTNAKYYERGELSVGNPPMADLVRKLGSKNLPASEPTTLSAMAYEIARRSGRVSYYATDRSSSDPFL